MKKFIALLLFAVSFVSCSPAWAADAKFSWSPNTQATLAGYNISYGTVSGKYTVKVDQKMGTLIDGRVNGMVTGLVAGTTYYFVCTAYDTGGYESWPSNIVTYKAYDRLKEVLTFTAAPEQKVTISVSP